MGVSYRQHLLDGEDWFFFLYPFFLTVRPSTCSQSGQVTVSTKKATVKQRLNGREEGNTAAVLSIHTNRFRFSMCLLHLHRKLAFSWTQIKGVTEQQVTCFTHHTNGDRLWQLKHLLLRYKMYYKKLATKSIQQQAPEYKQHESCLYTVKNILW